MFPTDLAIRPDELAREAEERGFESLFFPEHTHIPTSRRTPYPAGGELPEEYKRTIDPFVAMTAAANASTRLRVGTAICLVAQHDPVVLAKQVASADLISLGRVVFGVGYGWNVDEMETHGVDPRTRRALVREKVLAMKSLWTDEVASFDGEHVHLSPSWSWPKPVQKPHPPIIVGGAAGPTLFSHVVEWADGWMPIGGAGLRRSWPELRRVAEEAGRDPDEIEVMITGPRPDPELLDHYRSMGVSRVLLFLPPRSADVVLPLLDDYSRLL
jgi:probable F420-dependent oxidoreductase